jgi:hypothetical protein
MLITRASITVARLKCKSGFLSFPHVCARTYAASARSKSDALWLILKNTDRKAFPRMSDNKQTVISKSLSPKKQTIMRPYTKTVHRGHPFELHLWHVAHFPNMCCISMDACPFTETDLYVHEVLVLFITFDLPQHHRKVLI